MNCGKRVSTRCRCPTSVPAARCSSHSGWARPGPSKAIRKPSPAVFTSRPRNRANSLRTRTWCCCSSSPHFRPPISAACFVESTISVKRIVAKVRSGSAPWRIPVRNSSISSSSASESPTYGVWSAPASSAKPCTRKPGSLTHRNWYPPYS